MSVFVRNFARKRNMEIDGHYFETEKEYEDYIQMKEYNQWWHEATPRWMENFRMGKYRRTNEVEKPKFGGGQIRVVQLERPGVLLWDKDYTEL